MLSAYLNMHTVVYDASCRAEWTKKFSLHHSSARMAVSHASRGRGGTDSSRPQVPGRATLLADRFQIAPKVSDRHRPGARQPHIQDEQPNAPKPRPPPPPRKL